MPSYILKAERDSSEYIWWSDITESPLAIGTKDQIVSVMREECRRPTEWESERFERADKTGTSALWPSADDPAFGWDDDLIAEQRGILPRASLADYTRLRLAGNPAAFDLLRPFDDDNLDEQRQTSNEEN